MEELSNTHAANGRPPGSLELAYLGDAIYDLYVRTLLVRAGGRMKQLHESAVGKVRASAQSAAFLRIEDMLTEEEAAVARRARNAKQTPPRNADPAEYHRATAIEAVIGYVYLKGDMDRLERLLSAALDE